MSEVRDIVMKVLPPVLSGAAGVIGTAWRYAKGFADRLKMLEDWTNRFNDNFAVEGQRPVHAADALKKQLDDLLRNLKEIDEDLKRRSRERADTRRLQAKLAERCTAIESRLDACEKSINEMNTSFVTFSREQQEQWQDMTRTLGQVEGYLRAVSRPSGTFPETKPR